MSAPIPPIPPPAPEPTHCLEAFATLLQTDSDELKSYRRCVMALIVPQFLFLIWLAYFAAKLDKCNITRFTKTMWLFLSLSTIAAIFECILFLRG